MNNRREPHGVKKRTPNAYLANLEERLAALEGGPDRTLEQWHLADPVVDASLGFSPERAENEADASRQAELPHVGQSLPASSYSHAEGHLISNIGPSSPTEERQRQHSLGEDARMTNPLSAGPSDTGFISDITSGRSIYLGTSSNWSFSRRVLDGAHQAIHDTPLRSENLALDGDIYSLNWDGSRLVANDDKVALPSLNHANYLVRSVQFYIGEVYHLLDEEAFMSELNQFHENPEDDIHKRKLWYIHYLLVMALGKACVSRGLRKGTPPGVELFVRAMKLFPDVSQVWTDPFTTAEIFCCAALYLQGADFRYGAYMTIGNAMRTALFQGMHTDMPLKTFGASQVERARRIWWTVYVLDRQLGSLMGLPVQLSDEIITANLPAFNSHEQAAAFALYIQICRLNAQVVSTIYGPDGRLDKRFLTSTKLALTRIAAIAEKLSKSFKLVLNDPCENVSRMAATLHLQHHQCIVLTTRPLLFSLFKKRMEAPHMSPSTISSMQRLKVLLQMCTDSAQHSLSILSALQLQDFLATFVPFDLEATFSSGVIVLMASVVEPLLIENVSAELTKTYCLLDDLITKGNLIASRRKVELQQLEALLNAFKAREMAPHSSSQSTGLPHLMETGVSGHLQPRASGDEFGQLDHDASWINDQPYDEWTWEAALDAEQLMNVAGLLDVDQLDAFSADFNF